MGLCRKVQEPHNKPTLYSTEMSFLEGFTFDDSWQVIEADFLIYNANWAYSQNENQIFWWFFLEICPKKAFSLCVYICTMSSDQKKHL